MSEPLKVGDVVWVCRPVHESQGYGYGDWVEPRQMKIGEINPNSVDASYWDEETGEIDDDDNSTVMFLPFHEAYRTQIDAERAYLAYLETKARDTALAIEETDDRIKEIERIIL